MQLNDTGKDLYEYQIVKKMVVTETSKVHNDYEFVLTKDTLPYIVHQMQSYKNMNLSLLVYGNTLLNCGDVINLHSPLMQTREDNCESPYTSGRYLIMAIKHVIAVRGTNHKWY